MYFFELGSKRVKGQSLLELDQFRGLKRGFDDRCDISPRNVTSDPSEHIRQSLRPCGGVVTLTTIVAITIAEIFVPRFSAVDRVPLKKFPNLTGTSRLEAL